MEKDKTFILRLDRSTHGAVSTGCEESVLKDLQKDKNAVEKEREPKNFINEVRLFLKLS